MSKLKSSFEENSKYVKIGNVSFMNEENLFILPLKKKLIF